jgi:hypothetical protein
MDQRWHRLEQAAKEIEVQAKSEERSKWAKHLGHLESKLAHALRVSDEASSLQVLIITRNV